MDHWKLKDPNFQIEWLKEFENRTLDFSWKFRILGSVDYLFKIRSTLFKVSLVRFTYCKSEISIYLLYAQGHL